MVRAVMGFDVVFFVVAFVVVVVVVCSVVVVVEAVLWLDVVDELSVLTEL